MVARPLRCGPFDGVVTLSESAIFNAASTCLSELPIWNSPGGISTNLAPTLFTVSTSMPRCLAQAA